VSPFSLYSASCLIIVIAGPQAVRAIQEVTDVPQVDDAPQPDAQLSELIESVFEREREWAIDDRIRAAVKYGK
jgi:hypothetical protein